MSRIAFLGLGAMGSRMAASLVAEKHAVTVWNRNLARAETLREAGASVATSPRAAVADAEFVISMVRDDTASRQVWLDDSTGALGAIAPNSIAIECSTLGLEWTRELSARCTAGNRAFLDAPVVGSRPQAEQRQLIFLVGGTPEAFLRARPVLSQMGAAIHHAGQNGAGTMTKLVINALLAIQVAALAELTETIHRQGFDRERIAEIFFTTPVCSAAAATATRLMLADGFAPMFPVALVEKDLDYALAAGGTTTAVPMIAAAQTVFAQAIREGLGEQHFTSIAQLYRKISA
jgi:3-hydroxyisobutyrate dehydrogenase-like beta-hydroxyacid dehydrogenase